MRALRNWDAIIVGAGLAGLSAAIYLGRAQRKTLIIDAGKSMAKWEPKVENYLGFPEGISGENLLARAREQAKRCGVRFVKDEVVKASKQDRTFKLQGRKRSYQASKLLLATGIFHIPPDIGGVRTCLGQSMFFCKDCDGVRVKGRRIAIYGTSDEAAEYALSMLVYSPHVAIVTDGRSPRWKKSHGRWLREYQVPVYSARIERVRHCTGKIQSLTFSGGAALAVEALFTTRGDVFYNQLAKMLGARTAQGEIVVDSFLRTTVPGLYAAGCVTPANCQMIIAAGQGAAAAQSINSDLFKESIATHSLRRFRGEQLRKHKAARAPRMAQA